MARHCLNCGKLAKFQDPLTGFWICDGLGCRNELTAARKEIRKYRRRQRWNLFFEIVIPVGVIIGAAIAGAAVLQKIGVADFTQIF